MPPRKMSWATLIQQKEPNLVHSYSFLILLLFSSWCCLDSLHVFPTRRTHFGYAVVMCGFSSGSSPPLSVSFFRSQRRTWGRQNWEKKRRAEEESLLTCFFSSTKSTFAKSNLPSFMREPFLPLSLSLSWQTDRQGFTCVLSLMWSLICHFLPLQRKFGAISKGRLWLRWRSTGKSIFPFSLSSTHNHDHISDNHRVVSCIDQYMHLLAVHFELVHEVAATSTHGDQGVCCLPMSLPEFAWMFSLN